MITRFLCKLQTVDCGYLQHSQQKEDSFTRASSWLIHNTSYGAEGGRSIPFTVPSLIYIKSSFKSKDTCYIVCCLDQN